MSDPKDSRLSRIYREGAWPEPGRQIDDAILATSRRAAREQRTLVRRWAPSFAIAATVVLTSALVLKVYRAQPDMVSPAVSERKESMRVEEAPAAAAAAKPAAPAAAPQATSPGPGFALQMDPAEAERLDRLQRDLNLKRSLPATESTEADTAALKKEASDSTHAPSAPPRRQDQSQRAREAGAPQYEQQPASAPISVFGAPAQAPAQAAAPAAPPAEALPVPSEAARAVAGGLSSVAAKVPERTPQAWLDDIRKLKAEGKPEEAGAELTKFKSRYPDYVLPEDLR